MQEIVIQPELRRLTPRDIQVLEFIHSQPMNDCEAIRLQFWPGIDHHNHHRRLRVLQELGLIRKIYLPRSFRWAFRLNKRGVAALTNFSRQRLEKLVT